MIVDSIYDYINKTGKEVNKEILEEARERFGYTIKRQFMEDDDWDRTGKIYPSQMGKKCARQLSYKYHGVEYESDMAPRTKVKFFLGDLSELGALALGKLAGLDLGLSQSKLDIEVNGFETHGYIDGLLYDGDEPYVVEAKSKGKYGFQEFEKNGFKDNPAYMTQINLYMRNLDIDKGIFLVINTDSGHLSERVVNYNEKYIDIAKDNVDTVLKSTPDNLPERWVDLNSFKFMPRKGCFEIDKWQCSYCNYIDKCWGSPVKTEVIGGKPKKRIYLKDYKDWNDDVLEQVDDNKIEKYT